MNKNKRYNSNGSLRIGIGYAHAESQTPIRLVIHGGAGTITKILLHLNKKTIQRKS